MQDLAFWTQLVPPLPFPSRIDIAVYVVKLQTTYDPYAHSTPHLSSQRNSSSSQRQSGGFDPRFLAAGLDELKLGGQELTLSVHSIDPYTEFTSGGACLC